MTTSIAPAGLIAPVNNMPPWPPGVWDLPHSNVHFSNDGVSAKAILHFRFMGWRPTPAPAPDLDALLPAVGRALEVRPEFQAFDRARRDVADAGRAVRVAERDLLALDVAAASERLELRGAALATRLSEIDRERAAADARMADLQQGLVHLRRDLGDCRVACERALDAAVRQARQEAGPRLRSPDEILADLARAAAPFLDELGSWLPQSDPANLMQRARAELLTNEPPEEADGRSD